MVSKNFLQKTKPPCKLPFSLYLFPVKYWGEIQSSGLLYDKWQFSETLDECFIPEVEIFLADFAILEALHLFNWQEDAVNFFLELVFLCVPGLQWNLT